MPNWQLHGLSRSSVLAWGSSKPPSPQVSWACVKCAWADGLTEEPHRQQAGARFHPRFTPGPRPSEIAGRQPASWHRGQSRDTALVLVLTTHRRRASWATRSGAAHDALTFATCSASLELSLSKSSLWPLPGEHMAHILLTMYHRQSYLALESSTRVMHGRPIRSASPPALSPS